MLPDVADAQSLPAPAPSTPWLSLHRAEAVLPPQTCGKPLVIRPEVVCRWTARSLSSRTRTVMLPEMVLSRISLRRGLSRSQVIEPETVLARTRSAALSARISSPETVSRSRSPATPSASTGPETILARGAPAQAHQGDLAGGDVDPGVAGAARRRPATPSTRCRSASASAGHGDGDLGAEPAAELPEPPEHAAASGGWRLVPDAEPAVAHARR